MNTTFKRFSEVCQYQEKHGTDATIKEFGITEDTIARYQRAYRAATGELTAREPKIFTFDIETSPAIGAFFQPWKTNISPSHLLRDWHMLTWSGKWLGSKDVIHDRLTGKEAAAQQDARIAESLRNEIDKADIVIAHNGKKFDIKRLNTRLLIGGIPQPSPYRVIDTLQAVRGKFAFMYNNLDYLVKALELSDGKTDTDIKLWLDCIRGDDSALEKMDLYCQNDTLILEELYLRIRGWISGHPNIGVYMDGNEPVCHVCGSKNLTKSDGYHVTRVGKYETYRCLEPGCGAYSKVRTSSLSKEKRFNLLTSI